ncbi:hypothetical protein [Chitinophaga japonensis]|uniref:Uncharacterized protein n=1 Tax=Chitinophaga japonensis TaxID=104662 RepID=A0A562T097_CHIJA|nr:hypothetical protein [Chitinophaga japonensis]TWI86959.1 hypothetical protein LX66_4226 [Chitinophaga japonensis]
MKNTDLHAFTELSKEEMNEHSGGGLLDGVGGLLDVAGYFVQNQLVLAAGLVPEAIKSIKNLLNVG